MLKLPLEKSVRISNHMFPWTSCLPFVENSRGILIHRPRTVSTYNLHKAPHIGIGYWCGNHVAGDKNFTFLSDVPVGKFICHRCEDIAVMNGLLSSDEIVGRHVHKGKLIAVKTCGCV